MKAQYLIPTTEVVKVEACSLLQSISGLGLEEGGKDPGVKPRMPGNPIYF